MAESVHVKQSMPARPTIRVRRSTYQGAAEQQLEDHAHTKEVEDVDSDVDSEAASPIIVPTKFEKKFGHNRSGSRASAIEPWNDIATVVVAPTNIVRSSYLMRGEEAEDK